MRELFAIPPGGGSRVVGWTPDSRNVVLATLGEAWRVPLDGGAPQKSAIPGINMTQSAANRVVWTTGTMKTEIWALDNALPAK